MSLNEIFENNIIKILKGLAISGVITLILLLGYAILLTYTNMSENTMVPAIILITSVSILARKLYSVQVQLRKMVLLMVE